MSPPKAQFIQPRDTGRRTLDARKPLFDAAAIARAEQALNAMSGEFQLWLEEAVAKLQDARLGAESNAWSASALGKVFAAAHDLKGLGTTCRYPLATQISASLCRLIETDAGKAAALSNPALTCAHVDALRVVARDKITSDENPVGKALLNALETRVADLGVAPR
jgi:chemotaxis protein histidine kinase CheA